MASILQFAGLSPRERAACYRQYAKEAEKWAQSARTTDSRASCCFLAKQWNNLADQIDPTRPPARKNPWGAVR